MFRRVFQLLIAVMIAAISFASAITPARADDLGGFLLQVNALRALHGLGGLTVSPTLNSDAQSWTAHMASTGVLLDDPALASQVGGGWSLLGENTAYGSTFSLLFNALVNSAPHLANMLGNYTLTGFGEMTSGNLTWMTEIFEQPRSGSTTPAPVVTTPAARPAAAPAAIAKVVVPVHRAVPTTSAADPAPAPVTTITPATTSTTVAPPTTSTNAAPPPSVPSTVRQPAAASAPTVAATRVTPIALSAHEAPSNSFTTLLLAISLVMLFTVAGTGWLVARALRKR